jgi:two-component system sensor histidine kinase BarA
MQLGNFPVIDWEQAVKLAGNKKEFAEEMLTLLTKNLDHDMAAIKKTYFMQNYVEMLRLVHKLHGALCYCGLPRLKTIIAKLETALKNNIIDSLPHMIDTLDLEVKLLLEHYSHPHRL